MGSSRSGSSGSPEHSEIYLRPRPFTRHSPFRFILLLTHKPNEFCSDQLLILDMNRIPGLDNVVRECGSRNVTGPQMLAQLGTMLEAAP